jgi:hypothetical protein
MQTTSQKTEKESLKSLMVTQDTHSRIWDRIYQKQVQVKSNVSVEDIITDLLDKTESDQKEA